MAYHFGPTNNTKPATFALGFWNLVQAWLPAGWTIKESGDGLAAYSSTGSVFTNGGVTGANGFDNSGAWLRIAMPGTVGREFCIVRGSSTNFLAIAVSPANKFISGSPSATVAPTASDQQFLLGTALNATQGAAFTGGTAGQNYFNAAASDISPSILSIWISTGQW